MHGPLAYSSFFQVLFPGNNASDQNQDHGDLTLRRLKRFVPSPSALVRSHSLVVVDVETTGLDPKVDRIIEIGAIKLERFKPVAEFSSFVATDIPLTNDITRMTGITAEMLKGQPSMAEVLPQFLDFIEGTILVAHNAEFDLAMIRAACSQQGIDLEWPSFCTLKLAREFLAHLDNKKLDTIATYYGLSFEARHRAIGDIKVTCAVLERLLNHQASSLQTWQQFKPYVIEAL